MIDNQFVLPEEMPAIPTKAKVKCMCMGCDNYDPSATSYCSNDCYTEDMNRQHMRMEGSEW